MPERNSAQATNESQPIDELFALLESSGSSAPPTAPHDGRLDSGAGQDGTDAEAIEKADEEAEAESAAYREVVHDVVQAIANVSEAEGELSDDAIVEELRLILLGRERAQMEQVQAALEELARRTADKEGLIRTITPVMGDLIRNKIRDNRAEMIEVLYPIIGQLVVRAVAEAVRDLARKLDSELRTTYSVRYQGRRMWALLNGVSESDLILRDSLPFRITEIFLIHRESGLLLWHESLDSEQKLPDADLISSMLTAIRDFTADAFGNNHDNRLDEIQYGEHQILIEAAQHVYLAVASIGVEPTGFRGMLRRRIIAIQNSHHHSLVAYNGDATPFKEVGSALGDQLTQMRVLTQEASQSQKMFRAIVPIGVVIGFAIVVALLVWLR